jgi:peptidoglycan/xylan/chitin deacetylase (PgdA/CDA1 family)
MGTRVLLTIDTELTWRHFARGADWRDNLALSYDPVGVGVPWQLDLLARRGLKACFFVDPMPALVYGVEPIRRMVAPILAAGQEVQLHLHSFWSDLAQFRRENARFELTAFDADAQRELIAGARDLLVAAGAPPPIAFRSGSYAANADTLAALRALGLRYDSSHNGAEHPWPSALPLDPALIDPVELDGVIELPVGQIRRRDGGLRPLQLCALSSQEMQAALCHAAEHDHPLATIVSHSFELASRDGRRVNRLVRGRFERLCAFLDAHRSILPTSTMATLPAFAVQRRSHPLPARPLRTARRLVEQAWGDARYERPGLSAAMTAAPLAALGLLASYGGH